MYTNDDQGAGSTDGQIERAKEAALGPHFGGPSTADEIGEAAGGISGALVGAGIGSAAGPLGTLVGGMAGAIGGWWAGRAVSEAAERLTETDDTYYREHFESEIQPQLPADRGYDEVRGAYYLGQIASQNPNFVAREFEEVEPELARGWTTNADRFGPWPAVRTAVREGYTRGRERRANERLSRELEPNRPDDRRE